MFSAQLGPVASSAAIVGAVAGRLAPGEQSPTRLLRGRFPPQTVNLTMGSRGNPKVSITATPLKGEPLEVLRSVNPPSEISCTLPLDGEEVSMSSLLRFAVRGPDVTAAGTAMGTLGGQVEEDVGQRLEVGVQGARGRARVGPVLCLALQITNGPEERHQGGRQCGVEQGSHPKRSASESFCRSKHPHFRPLIPQ